MPFLPDRGSKHKDTDINAMHKTSLANIVLKSRLMAKCDFEIRFRCKIDFESVVKAEGKAQGKLQYQRGHVYAYIVSMHGTFSLLWKMQLV